LRRRGLSPLVRRKAHPEGTPDPSRSRKKLIDEDRKALDTKESPSILFTEEDEVPPPPPEEKESVEQKLSPQLEEKKPAEDQSKRVRKIRFSDDYTYFQMLSLDEFTSEERRAYWLEPFEYCAISERIMSE